MAETALIVTEKPGRRRRRPAPNTARRGDRKGNIPRVLIVAFLLVLTLFPLYYLIVTSLKSSGESKTNMFLPPLRGVHFENWLRVLPEVTQPAWNSTVMVLGAVVILLAIMAPCAYAFTWHRFPGKERLFTVAIVTMMLPSILTLVPQFILVKDLGLLNSKWAVILPCVAGSVGVSLYLLRAFFSALPDDLVEAARMDGASEMRILVQVILPLTGPALVTVAVLTAAAVWNQYLWPLITLTDPAERVASVAATFFASNPYTASSVPVLMSAYLISSLPLLIIMGVLLKYFMSGATQGALKG